MDIFEAIKERHSVRQYLDKPLEDEAKAKLEELIEECNKEGRLHIQLVCNEPEAFTSKLASYGHFENVSNYIVLAGNKGKSLDERCGYYGEKIVLEAQMLGLRTCWVKMSYKKVPGAFKIDKGEKLVCVIAIGYGANDGKERKSKTGEQVCDDYVSMPKWFKDGIDAALLAPTATNQQKFKIWMVGNQVMATASVAPCSKIDLGIVKYNFEVGAGKDNFVWARKDPNAVIITD
ncbi:MAG: nitroreductase family protein [Eubacterium sp.]|nr:nitroreductase family protein [Eubacterium sp.]MBR7073119.1 nitroreductase family protein [Eubacterium sp.]